MAEEEFQEGQQLTEEEYNKRWGRQPAKPRKKRVPKPKPVLAPVEAEVAEPQWRDNPNLSEQEMQAAEEEVSERQMVEWKEKAEPKPETDVEMAAALLKLDSRMAVRKEIIPAVDPKSGVELNMAIQLEEEYPEPFGNDLPKANLDDAERACIFGHFSIMNSLKTIGQAKDFPLVSASRFNNAQMNALVNISRGKGGFSAILSRTDKHVSEGVVSHVQRAFTERKQKRWGFF